MKKTTFFLISLISLLYSCKKESNKQITTINKEFNKINDAKWILGNWENISNEADFREIWTQKNDSVFIGKSFVTVKNDTVFNEKIDLLERNDSLFYIVSVENQNNEKPVFFYLTQSSKNELIFENPKHDFPNKIIYKKINQDSIIARIEGNQKGVPTTEDFPMKKSKK